MLQMCFCCVAFFISASLGFSIGNVLHLKCTIPSLYWWESTTCRWTLWKEDKEPDKDNKQVTGQSNSKFASRVHNVNNCGSPSRGIFLSMEYLIPILVSRIPRKSCTTDVGNKPMALM